MQKSPWTKFIRRVKDESRLKKEAKNLEAKVLEKDDTSEVELTRKDVAGLAHADYALAHLGSPKLWTRMAHRYSTLQLNPPDVYPDHPLSVRLKATAEAIQRINPGRMTGAPNLVSLVSMYAQGAQDNEELTAQLLELTRQAREWIQNRPWYQLNRKDLLSLPFCREVCAMAPCSSDVQLFWADLIHYDLPPADQALMVATAQHMMEARQVIARLRSVLTEGACHGFPLAGGPFVATRHPVDSFSVVSLACIGDAGNVSPACMGDAGSVSRVCMGEAENVQRDNTDVQNAKQAGNTHGRTHGIRLPWCSSGANAMIQRLVKRLQAKGDAHFRWVAWFMSSGNGRYRLVCFPLDGADVTPKQLPWDTMELCGWEVSEKEVCDKALVTSSLFQRDPHNPYLVPLQHLDGAPASGYHVEVLHIPHFVTNLMQGLAKGLGRHIRDMRMEHLDGVLPVRDLVRLVDSYVCTTPSSKDGPCSDTPPDPSVLWHWPWGVACDGVLHVIQAPMPPTKKLALSKRRGHVSSRVPGLRPSLRFPLASTFSKARATSLVHPRVQKAVTMEQESQAEDGLASPSSPGGNQDEPWHMDTEEDDGLRKTSPPNGTKRHRSH
jgi:hypothetical protein